MSMAHRRPLAHTIDLVGAVDGCNGGANGPACFSSTARRSSETASCCRCRWWWCCCSVIAVVMAVLAGLLGASLTSGIASGANWADAGKAVVSGGGAFCCLSSISTLSRLPILVMPQSLSHASKGDRWMTWRACERRPLGRRERGHQLLLHFPAFFSASPGRRRESTTSCRRPSSKSYESHACRSSLTVHQRIHSRLPDGSRFSRLRLVELVTITSSDSVVLLVFGRSCRGSTTPLFLLIWLRLSS